MVALSGVLSKTVGDCFLIVPLVSPPDPPVFDPPVFLAKSANISAVLFLIISGFIFPVIPFSVFVKASIFGLVIPT